MQLPQELELACPLPQFKKSRLVAYSPIIMASECGIRTKVRLYNTLEYKRLIFKVDHVIKPKDGFRRVPV